MLLFSALGAFLLLVVPYFLPVQKALSDSYCYGFSNRLAVLLFIAFLLAFGFWRGPIEECGELPSPAWLKPQPALLLALSLTCVAQLVAWAVATHFGLFQEALYFMDRLSHLAAGERPYRDFEYAYGIGLLYLPLWVSRAFHVPLFHAYMLTLLVEQILGILLVWYVVRSIGRDSQQRGAIFFLQACTAIAWTPLFGAQYTALRYWIVPAIAISTYRRVHRHGSILIPIALWLSGFTLTLCISPELAIGLLGGTLLFAALGIREDWRSIVPGLGFLLVCSSALLGFAAHHGAFVDAIEMAKGAYNVPITPALALLPVLGLLLVAACVLVDGVRTSSVRTPQIFLLCISPFFLPAAFGRCDPLHLLAYTAPAAIVAWFTIARNQRYWRWAFWGYVVIVFAIPSQIPSVDYQELKYVFKYRSDGKRPEVLDTTPLPTFYAPTGPIQPDHPGDRLPLRTRTGRFIGTENLMNAAEVQQLVAEIRAQGTNPILIAPLGCVWPGGRLGIFKLTTGLVISRAKRTNDMLKPICDELEVNFEPVPFSGLPQGIHLAKRKTPSEIRP